MLSATEKRFIRYWEEQREGGRWSYYATFIAVGTFIGMIIISTFLFVFLQVVFGSLSFWLGLVAALVISCVATIFTWSANEKKFKSLIRREIEKGESDADISDSGNGHTT